MAINAAFTDEVLTISCEVDIAHGVAHSPACQNACFLARLWHNLKK
jgi:hypothetical protein